MQFPAQDAPHAFPVPRIARPRGLRPLSPRPSLPQARPHPFEENVNHLLWSIERVIPALLHGTMVSIDRVSDHWFMLVESTTRNLVPFPFILSQRGWLPVARLDQPVEQEDNYCRTTKFQYSTDVPAELLRYRLSYADRRLIVASYLRKLLPEPNWELVKDADRQAASESARRTDPASW